MQLFYSPHVEDTFVLPPDDAHHLLTVLRRKAGETIHLTDGKGWKYEAKLLSNQAKNCRVEVLKKELVPKKGEYYIHIAVAPTKNLDRIEYFVEKAVEVGIDEISFFYSQHSERRQLNLARIEKIAIAALKQSCRFYLPTLNDMMSFSQFLAKKYTGQLFIAHETADPTNHLLQKATPAARYTVMIGAEGGFSDEEVHAAQLAGFEPVSLGEYRLRTETAAFASCLALNFLQLKKPTS
ncbi:MAG: 16S rRNA (uracil(1498)-N(3))-methyltransferase [Flammeovirgaceae bacterium]|nr:16S rRNA (uracil(1498)-N(3))-methyltransferase [Flammeovirgaceae bacterium]MDW8286968.1 16S rRNA (uracil(1498)-N(3))-methyltransferase [Flammeovirgaceae bacterium]